MHMQDRMEHLLYSSLHFGAATLSFIGAMNAYQENFCLEGKFSWTLSSFPIQLNPSLTICSKSNIITKNFASIISEIGSSMGYSPSTPFSIPVSKIQTFTLGGFSLLSALSGIKHLKQVFSIKSPHPKLQSQ